VTLKGTGRCNAEGHWTV